MNYISISQAATKFNVSDRYVRKLCTEGMIVGAVKVGNVWIIPENATISSKPSINIIFGGDDDVGFEFAVYLIEKGEKVCFISNSESQILKIVKHAQSKLLFVYNVDASNEDEIKKIKKDLSKYQISKLIFAENNARFDKAEDNTLGSIIKNFRSPIYSTVLATSIFYPLMMNTTIIAILHTKATTVGLPNETAFSAAYHGMNGFLDSVNAALQKEDKINNILKVYTGSIESKFWYSEDAKNVVNIAMENKIPPKDLATIAIDTLNSKNSLAVSEIHVRRIKKWAIL